MHFRPKVSLSVIGQIFGSNFEYVTGGKLPITSNKRKKKTKVKERYECRHSVCKEENPESQFRNVELHVSTELAITRLHHIKCTKSLRL
jgi:hypothetical protein